jgi:hypothetical protein
MACLQNLQRVTVRDAVLANAVAGPVIVFLLGQQLPGREPVQQRRAGSEQRRANKIAFW